MAYFFPISTTTALKAGPDWGISGLASKSKSKSISISNIKYQISKSNPKGAFALIDAGVAVAGVHLSHLCRENRESTPHLRPRPRGSVFTPARSGLRAAATYTIHDTALTAHSMFDARCSMLDLDLDLNLSLFCTLLAGPS
jgi:hypothetical protein